MGDGWTDNRERTVINFLVYCPRGVAFIKSVDASNVVKDASLLFRLFKETIEWEGVSNVVHMVISNGSNYVAAGKKISETYKNINWSLCAAHCLNLIFSDICKLEHGKKIVKRASQITQFVYNRTLLIAWLRKRERWYEIICRGATHFGTTFIALHSIFMQMYHLKDLIKRIFFTDSRFAKERKGKVVVPIVLDNKFWNDCLIVVKIVEPLMRLLHIVDGDAKPSIGYVYEGMYRIRKSIKSIFKGKKRLYKPYMKIIKEYWDRQMRKNIYAAAYWLNLAFQYDQKLFCKKEKVKCSFLDVVESKATCSKTKLLEESALY